MELGLLSVLVDRALPPPLHLAGNSASPLSIHCYCCLHLFDCRSSRTGRAALIRYSREGEANGSCPRLLVLEDVCNQRWSLFAAAPWICANCGLEQSCIGPHLRSCATAWRRSNLSSSGCLLFPVG
jgi:hypothetical protein